MWFISSFYFGLFSTFFDFFSTFFLNFFSVFFWSFFQFFNKIFSWFLSGKLKFFRLIFLIFSSFNDWISLNFLNFQNQIKFLSIPHKFFNQIYANWDVKQVNKKVVREFMTFFYRHPADSEPRSRYRSRNTCSCQTSWCFNSRESEMRNINQKWKKILQFFLLNEIHSLSR